MHCLSVVYVSVISFSDTGEETQQSAPVASRNRFCPWELRCSLHVERSPRFSILAPKRRVVHSGASRLFNAPCAVLYFPTKIDYKLPLVLPKAVHLL